MQTFRAQDIQKKAAILQEAALVEPVIITRYGRPRMVLMSMTEYDRLRGRRGSAAPATDFSGDPADAGPNSR
jgi:prevent-host-death family protein